MTFDYAWTWFMVAVCAGLTDLCWTLYMMSAAAKRPLAAALWSCGIILLGSFTIVQYVQDHSMLWASLVGSFLGTYWAVKSDEEEA